MEYRTTDDFLARGAGALAKGPVALILAEDGVELASTVEHHLGSGFRSLLLFAAPDVAAQLPEALRGPLHLIAHDMGAPEALSRAVNPVIAAAPPGTWFYYGYNAEYLFHPFRESRSLPEMLAFHMEERRDAAFAAVVDLWAPDLERFPLAVSRDTARIDRRGYYALARHGAAGERLDRQIDLYGGLRRRFEEHVPADRRRIDRVALFRSVPGLQILPDHRTTIAEYNTVAGPWHHNLTVAIASFRTAKALCANPASRDEISGFNWPGAVDFNWTSEQLMQLGLMEPGQWF